MAINISYSISKWSLEQFQSNGILFYISQCLLPPLNVHQSSKLNCRLSVIDKPFIVHCPLFCFITGIISLIWQSPLILIQKTEKDITNYFFSTNLKMGSLAVPLKYLFKKAGNLDKCTTIWFVWGGQEYAHISRCGNKSNLIPIIKVCQAQPQFNFGLVGYIFRWCIQPAPYPQS